MVLKKSPTRWVWPFVMGPAALVERSSCPDSWTPWPSGNAGGGLVQHRPPDMFCEGLQVLHDSGEVEAPRNSATARV
jgi:hypothetical protein